MLEILFGLESASCELLADLGNDSNDLAALLGSQRLQVPTFSGPAKKLQSGAKEALHRFWWAQAEAGGEAMVDQFIATVQDKWLKTKDRLTNCDFPMTR